MSEVVLSNVRLSYVNVWEPRPNLTGVMKYSVSVLMEKKNKTAIATCEKAVKEAIDAAVKAGKLSKAQVSIVQNPLRDGTKEYEVEKKDANYKGLIFFNANSDNRPSVVDEHVNPIFDQEELYSGCWANVAVSFYFTNKGGEPKVAVGINHIMKTRDDERLDGRTNVTEAFAQFLNADTEGTDSGDLT